MQGCSRGLQRNRWERAVVPQEVGEGALITTRHMTLSEATLPLSNPLPHLSFHFLRFGSSRCQEAGRWGSEVEERGEGREQGLHRAEGER